LHAIGIPSAMDHIAKFGFDTDKLPGNLSLALGSGAISPWQLASAYCILANGGYKVEPYFIDRIESYNDEIIFQANPLVLCRDCDLPAETPEEANNIDSDTAEPADEESEVAPDIDENDEKDKYSPQVVKPQNIWIMQSMMRDVIQHGTGRKARSLKRSDLAGKTGTTNDQRDAWFSGFNSSLVTISWVGFDQFQPLGNGETGGKAALPMWIKYMKVALEDVPVIKHDPPSGMLNLLINKKTGLAAKSDDPDAFFEEFRVEHAPAPNKQESDPDPYNPDDQDVITPELF
jgi:penicillin-binding protein 1A